MSWVRFKGVGVLINKGSRQVTPVLPEAHTQQTDEEAQKVQVGGAWGSDE